MGGLPLVEVVDPQKLLGCASLSSMMTFLAMRAVVGMEPTPEVEKDLALGGDVGGLHDGHVDVSQRAGTQGLLQLGQVHVEEFGAPELSALRRSGLD